MSIEGLKYTGIGDKNRSYFDKMLYDDKPAEAGDVLRVGLIMDEKMVQRFEQLPLLLSGQHETQSF